MTRPRLSQLAAKALEAAPPPPPPTERDRERAVVAVAEALRARRRTKTRERWGIRSGGVVAAAAAVVLTVVGVRAGGAQPGALHRRRCVTSVHRCVRTCGGQMVCPNPATRCDLAQNLCIECATSADSTRSAGRPVRETAVCDPKTNACVMP